MERVGFTHKFMVSIVPESGGKPGNAALALKRTLTIHSMPQNAPDPTPPQGYGRHNTFSTFMLQAADNTSPSRSAHWARKVTYGVNERGPAIDWP